MARILIVEDEPTMAEAIARGLTRHGHTVDIAPDGASALSEARLRPYDVVLLDRDLPLVHGDEVCAELTQEGYPGRILMLTAAGDLADRVGGLRLGADDYLPKPFAFDELVARVDALLRRAPQRSDATLIIGDLEIDPNRRLVTRSGVPVALTNKEFGVLSVLAREPGRFVSAESLLDQVWDENADPFTGAVRVTMVGLRKKLGAPEVIETMRAVGYRLKDGVR